MECRERCFLRTLKSNRAIQLVLGLYANNKQKDQEIQFDDCFSLITLNQIRPIFYVIFINNARKCVSQRKL